MTPSSPNSRLDLEAQADKWRILYADINKDVMSVMRPGASPGTSEPFTGMLS